jgi:hypothetical protein
LFIYLLTNGNHYKIGFTKNINNRIKQLQTGSSTKIELISSYKSDKFYSIIENALHRTYNIYQTSDNEWFDLPINEILNFKENCRKIENNLLILEKHKKDI